jgi:hypothetical protein
LETAATPAKVSETAAKNRSRVKRMFRRLRTVGLEAEAVRNSALHEPEDQVAFLLVNRHRGQTLQRIANVETIVAPQFQNWLRDQNRSGSDVLIGMNPLKDGATSCTMAKTPNVYAGSKALLLLSSRFKLI